MVSDGSRQEFRRPGRGRLKLHTVSGLARLCRDRTRILRSGLFNRTWYTEVYAVAWPFPSLHYLCEGAVNGRSPGPLFDAPWYLEEYPDVRGCGADPVLHYLLFGASEGRDPNPFFSSSYYLAAYPDVADAHANPLAHYIRFGAAEGRRPSPKFDPAFYRRQLPPADADIADPLAHFLTVGREAGLAPSLLGGELDGEPVEWSTFIPVRPWTPRELGSSTALFVTHAPGGRVRPHVRHHINALVGAGVEVVLIVATEADEVDETGLSALAGLYMRENAGFDFAAWAHMLKVEPRFWDSRELLLVNDSILGPVDGASHKAVLHRALTGAADIVGLTDSREKGWHLQSYFLVIRASALRNPRLQAFFSDVRTLMDKQSVIDRYEVGLSSVALEAGLRLEALFPSLTGENMTLYGWRDLLDAGFPFLKISVPSGRFTDVDATGWRQRLMAAGYPAVLADAALEPLVASARPSRPRPPAPPRPGSVAFYGPFNFDNGLGQASRGYVSALFRVDRPRSFSSLETPFHIHRRRNAGAAIRDFVEAAETAIVHLNPDSWHLLTDQQRKEISRAGRRVGLWVWEMDIVPDFFAADFQSVDAIWTPSTYCARLFSSATDRPVSVVPHVVPVPPLSRGQSEHMILFAFDGSSYLARKNPGALVSAFAKTGLCARGWTLVLKTKNLSDETGARDAAALREICQRTPGVSLIDAAMSREALDALLARASVYASPHASEGFGLTIAEAMAAGKVVIATDHGGSQDFLDSSCGLPVVCGMVTLTQTQGHYIEGGSWAQVDVDALALALEQAAFMVERGDHSLGDAARARVRDRLSSSAVAQQMEKALDALAASPLRARQ